MCSFCSARRSHGTECILNSGVPFLCNSEKWFIDRPMLGPIPVLGHLELATNLFRKFKEIHMKHYDKVPSEIFDDLWMTFIQQSEYTDSRILGAFLSTRSEWEGLWANMTLKEIRIQDGIRTTEWLQEHGTCADNMKEGVSSIRQAGRGAFATRKLLKDSVVAPLPLVHVSDNKIFEMYDFEDLNTHKTQHVLNGYQLMLNYCFGNPKSTLLLCPYGPVAHLVNHNQTQANVKLRWVDSAKGNHEPGLLQKPIEHFARDKTAKLAMELVATRDIQPEEEIFLDYGDEWEAAWQRHVQQWKPFQTFAEYTSSHQFNNSTEKLRTVFYQMYRPYPNNVELQCDLRFFRRIDFPLFQQEGLVVIKDRWYGNVWVNCDVLRYREVNGTLRYTAVGYAPADGDRPATQEKLTDAPIEAFRFIDNAYTTDMFLPNAFRRSPMIPDDIFPEYWMNL